MKMLVLFPGQLAVSLPSASDLLGRDITFTYLCLLKSCLVYSRVLDQLPSSLCSSWGSWRRKNDGNIFSIPRHGLVTFQRQQGP